MGSGFRVQSLGLGVPAFRRLGCLMAKPPPPPPPQKKVPINRGLEQPKRNLGIRCDVHARVRDSIV